MFFVGDIWTSTTIIIIIIIIIILQDRNLL